MTKHNCAIRRKHLRTLRLARHLGQAERGNALPQAVQPMSPEAIAVARLIEAMPPWQRIDTLATLRALVARANS
jgi:hypothetical protein